jgi:hypothetical protein
VLELGKDLFDRVQVGRVFWQEEEFGADERMSWRTALLLWLPSCPDDDIAGTKVGQKNLLDIGRESSRHRSAPR